MPFLAPLLNVSMCTTEKEMELSRMTNHVIPTTQASCCLTCSSLMRGASFTRYWRCSATGCTTSSHTTESSCSATCTAWLLFPRPTRTSCTCGNASSPEAVHKVSTHKKTKQTMGLTVICLPVSLTAALRAQLCG